MLRMDRNSLPALPRPVFAIGAEHAAPDEILVSVQAGQGENSRCAQFPLIEQSQLERRLSQWLRGLPYFEAGHCAWGNVSDQAAMHIARWACDAFLNTPVKGQDHE